MYRYLDNYRIQLWFDSPNICAAFLCMTVLLTIGVFVWLRRRHSNPQIKIANWIVLFPLIILQFGLIAQTYSRGGWLALGFVLLLLAIICRNKVSYLLFSLFILSLLLSPRGSDRIYSSTAFHDGSIKHRFLLWNGALGIIAKHPIAGAPNGEIGKYYTEWYQPLWLNEGYLTFINDYLTIAGRYGIFALYGYLLVLFIVVYCASKLYLKIKNSLLLYGIAAMLCYMLCALFSTIYVHINAYWLFCAHIIIIGIIVVWAVIYKRIMLTWRELSITLVIPTLICFGILLFGFWINSRLPYHFEDRGNLIIATPKALSQAQIICVLSSDDHDRIAIIRKIIRPLLLEGYAVTAFQITPGLNGFSECENLLSDAKFNKNNLPIFIFAGNDVANIAVCRQWDFTPVGIITVNLPVDWPWEELSPVKHLTTLQSPLLLLRTGGLPYSPEEQDRLRLANNLVTFVNIEDEASIIQTTNNFISQLLQEN